MLLILFIKLVNEYNSVRLHQHFCYLQACKDMARVLFDLLDLLVICITFYLLVFPVSSDDNVRNIRVEYNGRNRPTCLSGNGTACQSLDYIFKNLQHVQAQTITVTIASPQVITVKSALTSDSTNTLTLLGDNKDATTGSNRVSINFNLIDFSFPCQYVTLQGLEIVDSRSLIFISSSSVLINDCSLTRVACVKIDPGNAQNPRTKLIINDTLVHNSNFNAVGFLYYIPVQASINRNYYIDMYISNSIFTKNTGKMLTMIDDSCWGYSSYVRVENCTFYANIDPDFNFTITTALDYDFTFNVTNTKFYSNTDLSMIIGLSGSGGVSSQTRFNVIGVNMTENKNTTLLTGDKVYYCNVQVRDSLFSNNDGLIVAMNSSLGYHIALGPSVIVSNVQFEGNKRWFVDVQQKSLVDINNCSFMP